MQTSNCQIAIDNYFTSSALLGHLSAMGVAAAGTVRASGIENTNKLPVNNQFNRPNIIIIMKNGE